MSVKQVHDKVCCQAGVEPGASGADRELMTFKMKTSFGYSVTNVSGNVHLFTS